MTEQLTAPIYGDPINRPFWEGAQQHKLLIQRCPACNSYQFYARPFCLKCPDETPEWVESKGTGTIYSLTTVRMKVSPDLIPPYQVAIIELDEGPRLLAGIAGDPTSIGQRVAVTWKERADLPPIPMFKATGSQT